MSHDCHVTAGGAGGALEAGIAATAAAEDDSSTRQTQGKDTDLTSLYVTLTSGILNILHVIRHLFD